MTHEQRLQEVIRLQRLCGLKDVHVVYLGEDEFSIAHPDEERLSDMRLLECPLHQWLASLDKSPRKKSGLYVATPHIPDADSEPYLSDPWDLEAIV